MKRPYDLVSFMQQEERAELLNILKDEMSSKKFDETVDHVVEQTSFDQVCIFLDNKFFTLNHKCSSPVWPIAARYLEALFIPRGTRVGSF